MRVTPTRLAVAAAVVLTVAAGLRLVWSPAVSARELLQRSIQAETARLSQVAEPVVYRKLQVRRRAGGGQESIAWEIWNSARGNQAGRFRQRVADTHGLRFVSENEPSAPRVIAELERIFRANHLDLQRPLSAAGYADWRKTIRPAAETVTEVALQDDHPGLKLTTVARGPYASNAIIEASLIVRRADWHPVAEHLKVQGEHEVHEYELSEAAYEVMPLAALTVFAEPAPTPLPTVTPALPARVPAAASPASSIKPIPTAAELQNAEVAALYALHQARADLGEQIEIVRDPAGLVVVRGLVENAERKEQLTKALGDLSLVTAQIQTVEEAQRAASQSPKQNGGQKSGQKSSALPTEAPAALAADAEQIITGKRGPQQLAFRAGLERYFASVGAGSPVETERRITELTNQSLALSEAALARAWALRRLAENPALKKTEALTLEARARQVAMLENHRTELREQVRSLRGKLQPCLTFMAGGHAGEMTSQETSAGRESDWAESALAVFRSVSQLDRLLHRMFSSNGPASGPPEAAREVLAVFADAEAALGRLEIQTGRLSADK